MPSERSKKLLENRGFTIDKVEDGFEIRIGRRSLPAGLNEIFVGTDELDAIVDLGHLETICSEKDLLMIKVMKRHSVKKRKNHG
jgi:hypothetical protein